MNFVRAYNCIFATVLIIVYLLLPASNLAHAATSVAGDSVCQVSNSQSASTPCDSCPCSDEQGHDCCDTTSCSCTCHAPPGQNLQLAYAPSVAAHSFYEPSWSLPQVFLSIFVPPQNAA